MSNPPRSRPWPWFVAAVVIVLVFLSTFVRVRVPGDWDPRPRGTVEDIAKLRSRKDVNLLFIVIDTLRADRLGMYGYARDTSPTLDRFAATGVRFDRHLAQSSWTKTSMASLWTGLLPSHTGIMRFDHVLPQDAVMPAEILKAAGFQTIGLYRNGWVAPTFGFDQGFETYLRPVAPPLAPGIRRENPTLSDAGTDEATVAAALEFLHLRGHERWFLYMHMMDVHEYLYDEESALFGVHYSDVYDNSVRWTDGVLETLLSSLGEQGYLENTVIVITSDHGEAFGEHGFEGHARKLYREVTEIPLLILFPFRLDPGVVIETRTQSVDVWPTVLDLFGLSLPGADGRSRLPEILGQARGEPTQDGEHAIAHLDQTWGRPSEPARPTVSVSEGPLRYIRIEQEGMVLEQLFDAEKDPAEMRDRANERPDDVARLSKAADTYLEKQPAWGAAPTRELSELELSHLRALGYAIP
jgi:arylsulfatase A-like enzyme